MHLCLNPCVMTVQSSEKGQTSSTPAASTLTSHPFDSFSEKIRIKPRLDTPSSPDHPDSVGSAAEQPGPPLPPNQTTHSRVQDGSQSSMRHHEAYSPNSQSTTLGQGLPITQPTTSLANSIPLAPPIEGSTGQAATSLSQEQTPSLMLEKVHDSGSTSSDKGSERVQSLGSDEASKGRLRHHSANYM